MNLVFTKIVNMSISAGILISAVILIRLLSKKIPRKIFIIVWILVMIRLVCPVSFSNTLSPVPGEFCLGNTLKDGSSGITNSPEQPGSEAGQTETQAVPATHASTLDNNRIFCALWIAGMVIILTKAGIKTLKLRRTVKEANNIRDNVFLSPKIKSSFVLGIVRPRIYIPSSLGKEYLRYVIDHEKEHIIHGDHLLKFLFYIIVAVHWFNPLCHMAYHMFSEDLEMACDERTLNRRDTEYRANYIQTLLDCEIYSSALSIGTLSFGSIGIKRRIERIMSYKKPGIISLAVFACICFALIFFLMTDNAAAAEIKNESPDYDDGMHMAIRDANGEEFEAIEVEDAGQLELPESPAYNDNYTSMQYDSLSDIREEVLKEGVYRCDVEKGEPFFAVCDGRVISAKYEKAYGYCVTIEDDEGRLWKYGHCSKLTAKEGDSISIGNLIAYTGISGLTPVPAVIIRIVKQ